VLFDAIRYGRRPRVRRRRTAVPWRLARQAGRRLGWGVADQAVSSITNFAVNIYIARELGAIQYGAFALAYVTYGFALNASRGLATDPLLVRFSATDLPTWRRAVAACTGTAVLVGLAAGACVLGAAALLGGTARLAFLALGLTLPGLMLQDSWRFAFFALGRGSQAFLNDMIWAGVLLPALIFLRLTGHANVFWLVFAWGASAAVAAAAGPLQARVVPRLQGAAGWLSRHRDLGVRYLAEGTVNSAATQVRTYSVGIILGLAALGYLQAASTLMGPLQILIFGMGLVALPEAARILRRSPRHMSLFCALLSAGLILLGLVWGVALLIALPRGLGHLLLGSIWRPTYPLVLPTALYFMGQCAGFGAGIWLHALAAARRSLRASLLNTAAYVSLALVGAVEGGALGSIRGAAVGSWIGALLCWWQLRAALRESRTVPVDDRLAEHDLEPSIEPLRSVTASGLADGDAMTPAVNGAGERPEYASQPGFVTQPEPKTSRMSVSPPTWWVVVSSDQSYYDRMRITRALIGLSVPVPAYSYERRFVLTGKQVRIGRRSTTRELEPEIDLAGPRGDPGISRLHAVLIASRDGRWAVLDPGSANGTLLNGRRIATGDPVTLHDGDRINLGTWTVITVHRRQGR
jgi:O-antigen/teichoic acid export membrane protein